MGLREDDYPLGFLGFKLWISANACHLYDLFELSYSVTIRAVSLFWSMIEMIVGLCKIDDTETLFCLHQK